MRRRAQSLLVWTFGDWYFSGNFLGFLGGGVFFVNENTAFLCNLQVGHDLLADGIFSPATYVQKSISPSLKWVTVNFDLIYWFIDLRTLGLRRSGLGGPVASEQLMMPESRKNQGGLLPGVKRWDISYVMERCWELKSEDSNALCIVEWSLWAWDLVTVITTIVK